MVQDILGVLWYIMQVVEFYSRNMEAWCVASLWLFLVGSHGCYKRKIEIFGKLEPHARSSNMAVALNVA